MKKSVCSAVIMLFCSVAVFAQYPITPVPFTSVKMNDSFWSPRLLASRDVTVPLAFDKCEETGRYTNFTNAAKCMANPAQEYPDASWTFTFDDTDPYKTIEGASYLLQTYPKAMYHGRRLDKYVDSVIAVIGSGQEPDGYLFTPRTKAPSKPHSWAGSKRWEKVEELSHEFYNLGHLLEAACAHYQATGKRNFLDIAIKYADCVCREIGPGENQAHVVPGHQIAEMGLCKLYVLTKDKKYLDMAKYFLDMRGKTKRKDAYSQAHKPVVEQDEAVGHAVRAEYMYSGMADVAALTGDTAYIHAIDRIWQNIVEKKYYITGGVGARHSGEAFGNNYELPNASAYCETCAQIGNVYTNYRLFLLHGESKYFDVLERTLYNGLISGVSIQGDAFFYPNPLSCTAEQKYARKPWFGCACCPSNICRFIPSVPGYVYAVKDNAVFVNLFMGNTATLNVGGKNITLKQETVYPQNGDVKLTVEKGAGEYTIKIRIPGWVKGEVVPSDLYAFVDGKKLGYTIKVNGQPLTFDGKSSMFLDKPSVGLQPSDYNVQCSMSDGYAVIERKWKKGDVIDIHFDMEPRLVKANDKVEADCHRLSVERGPLVYCAEWPDNTADVSTYLLNARPQLAMGKNITIVPGHEVQSIVTQAQTLSIGADGKLKTTDAQLTLIPYYAWDHRGQEGGMDVWLPAEVSAASATHVKAEKQQDNGFFR